MDTDNNVSIVADETINEAPKVEPPSFTIKAFYRKMSRKFTKLGIEHTRVQQTPKVDQSKSDFSQYRSDLARSFGSKTGKLKKKHLNRQRLETALSGTELENSND